MAQLCFAGRQVEFFTCWIAHFENKLASNKHCNALITERVGVLILICMTVGGKAYYQNLYLSGPQRCLGIKSVITSHSLKASLTHTHTAFPYTF